MEEQEAPKEFIISAELLQDILNYFAEQKFKEVNHLITGIQQSVKPVEVPDEGLKKVE